MKSTDKEVQDVMKHFINTITCIQDGTWQHYGSCFQTKEYKSIPPPGKVSGRMLVSTVPPTWERDEQWVVDQLNKNIKRLKIVVEDKRGEPYMNDYRHWWGLEKVPGHTWRAEEKIVSAMGESLEHDSGEVVSEDESDTEDDGDMPRVVQMDESSDSESDFSEEEK